MNLDYSDEQKLLRDSAESVLARAGGADPAKFWGEMASLGWLGLAVPEAHGGLEQTAVDTAILTEAFGRHLVGSGYVPAAVLCARLVASAGSAEQAGALLPGLVDGSMRLAFAHAEAGSRWRLAHVETRAARAGAGWTLDGVKTAAVDGGAADRLIVSARTDGAAGDEKGLALFVVDPKQAGVTVDAYPTVDGGEAATVSLAGVAVGDDMRLAGDGDPFPHMARAWDHALAAWCSEAVGMIDAALKATIDYTKVRVQFGRPLAANQVLRHRMADMAVALEEARSIALRAAILADDPDAQARSRAVAGAWAKVSASARFATEQAIQMHGGMGVTDELRVGLYLKRLMAIDAIAGGARHHLQRYAALTGRLAA